MRDLTEIVCILDQSGSMNRIKEDVIGSFNNFLSSQKEEAGDARISLITFDSLVTPLYESINLQDVENLTSKTYKPGGGTALHDAVGLTIDSVGSRLASMNEDERPNKVIVVIITDGEENQSGLYTQSKIAEMIEHQKTTYAWSFIFLAANQDACLAAESIGISKGNAMFFSSSAAGMGNASENLSRYMSRTRGMSSVDYMATLDNALLSDEKDARDDLDKI